MSFLSELFGIGSHESDGWSQAQREALIDLLTFAMYADNHISLDESRSLEARKSEFSWESNVAVDIFANDSVTRARNARNDAHYKADYLDDIASRLSETEAKREAYSLCERLIKSDGQAEKEKAFLDTLKSVFNLN